LATLFVALGACVGDEPSPAGSSDAAAGVDSTSPVDSGAFDTAPNVTNEGGSNDAADAADGARPPCGVSQFTGGFTFFDNFDTCAEAGVLGFTKLAIVPDGGGSVGLTSLDFVSPPNSASVRLSAASTVAEGGILPVVYLVQTMPASAKAVHFEIDMRVVKYGGAGFPLIIGFATGTYFLQLGLRQYLVNINTPMNGDAGGNVATSDAAPPINTWVHLVLDATFGTPTTFSGSVGGTPFALIGTPAPSPPSVTSGSLQLRLGIQSELPFNDWQLEYDNVLLTAATQ
jgi:hypothetical protein